MTATTPDFIFMLTRADRTVPDAQARLAEALDAGVRHVGFKDLGLPFPELRRLADAIRRAGGTSYLELVSPDTDGELAAARAALRLEVDVLMGGTQVQAVLPLIAGRGLRYLPFVGRVEGHPSRLVGDRDEILADARRIAGLEGVAGLDLLAYRGTGDAARLVAEICAAVDKPVIVAGSIDRPDRIAAVVAAGATGFTVGSAALDGLFPAASEGLADQLAAILQVLEAAVVAAGAAGGSW